MSEKLHVFYAYLTKIKKIKGNRGNSQKYYLKT